MKTINLKGLEMDVYEETLENGLKIYMLPYENKKNYFISFATRFGSNVLEFIDENNEKQVPPLGIAHFLEHKMFEQSSGEDPFTFFSKSGTDSNASTSFDNTQYICYGTKDFATNLRYLLNVINLLSEFLVKRLAFIWFLIYYLFVVIPPDNLIISNPKYPFWTK